MKSKSYHYKILMSYVTIIVIFVAAIFFVFYIAHKNIKEQILISSQNEVYQFGRHVDEVLDEAKEACVNILNNSDNKFYSKRIIDAPDKKSYYVWKICEQLKQYNGKKYFDIFEYYPNEDYVVSALHPSSNVEFYCDIFYGDLNGETEAVFRNIVSTISKKPVLTRMQTEEGVSYLCVVMSQSNYKKEENDYSIVFVLNPTYVSDLLDVVWEEKDSRFSFIKNDLGEYLYFTDDFIYNYEFLEDDYFIQMQESAAMDLTYGNVVPRSYFWSRLIDLQIVCGLSILSVLALGGFVVLKKSDELYEPIKNVVNEVQEYAETPYDVHENTEMEFIKLSFAKEKLKKDELNMTVKRTNEFKKKHFMHLLLKGNNEIEAMAQKEFAEMGIEFPYDCFCVVILVLEKCDELSGELILFALGNVYEECLSHIGKAYLIALDRRKYALLVNVKPDTDINAVKEKIVYGKSFFKKHCNIIMTVSLSGIHKNIGGIHDAYKDAEKAIEYRYLLGRESVISYPDIADREFDLLQISEFDMYHMVTDFFEHDAEREDVRCLVEDIMETCRIDKEKSMGNMKYFEAEIIKMLQDILQKEGWQSAEWKKKVLKLSLQTTLQDFKECLIDVLWEMHAEKMSGKENKDICYEVKEYIEAHFEDEQLCRNFLGNIFSMDPGYLSKIFKERYQSTIPEYISGIRVENAKWQLKNTDYQIQEISKKNGFVNSASFIRTFKRQEGITPSDYRELSRRFTF